MGSLVLFDVASSGIATIRFNDPERRNAMSEDMAREFQSVVTEVRRNHDVRVVVLTGNGSAFSGGGDLQMLFEKTKIEAAENERLMKEFYQSFLSLREIDVPLIAAINGHAVGAGLCVAMGCDIRIAAESAKLGLNFVLLGLHPGMGATYFLPRLVGSARAAELLFTGAIITATEALRDGLVSRVVGAERVYEEANEIASLICQAGPEVVRQLKRTLRDSEYFSLNQSLEREAQCQSLNYAGPEFLEGISAAREKRKPAFALSSAK